MASLQLGVVMNRKAGSVLGRSTTEMGDRLRAALEPIGPVVAIEVVSGSQLKAAIEKLAADPNVDTLVAAGGDGTVSMAARQALLADKRLLPLPFGTFNLFSRTLGWGGDPAAALEKLEHGFPATVDVGVVNDIVFVHHVSCGLHPRYIRLRDAISFHSRLGKIAAGARALFRTLRSTPLRQVRIDLAEQSLERRALGVAVTVNELAELVAEPPVPDNPEGGQLAIYVAHAETLLGRLRLMVNAFRGHWRDGRNFESAVAPSATVRTGHGRIPLSIDGEFTHLPAPLEFSIRAQALKVVRSRAA